MSRKKIIIIVGVTLILGGLLIWAFIHRAKPSPESFLIEDPKFPKEQWLRKITVEENQSGFKVVINHFDGYQISVPSTWSVNNESSPEAGLKIFYGSGTDSELTDGLILNIFTFDNQMQAEKYLPPDARFLEIKTNRNLPAYKTSYKVTQDRTNPKTGEIVETPNEQSLIVSYIFHRDKEIYLVFCQGQGEGYQELVSQCEKQVMETFVFLD